MSRINAILGILVIGLSGACGDSKTQLPLRKDCITKVSLDWSSGVSKTIKEEIIDNIADAIMFSGARGGPDLHPNLALQGENRELLYMQFPKNCEYRVRNAHELLGYVKQVVAQSPAFHVSRNTVKPGAETIDVWGPH